MVCWVECPEFGQGEAVEMAVGSLPCLDPRPVEERRELVCSHFEARPADCQHGCLKPAPARSAPARPVPSPRGSARSGA